MHFIRGLRLAIRRALAVIGRNTKRISKTFKSSCRTRIDNYICTPLGRLAQLVQSTCLTSRGSGVRIPQRPQPKDKESHPRKWVAFLFWRDGSLLQRAIKRKKPNAAEQRMAFFIFLVGYKGTSEGFF